MSLITFLNAVGGDELLGDLAHLETIPTRDRYFRRTPPSRGGVSIVHTIQVPAGRKFIMIGAAVLKPGGTSTGNFRAYFDLRFGGNTFDRIWFDDTENPKTRAATYSHFLIGNGSSQIEIVRRSATEDAEVIIVGYYRDNITISPSQAVQELTADERSPDDIRLAWIAPLNSGGAPIVGYRIRRGDTIVAGQVSNFLTIVDNTGNQNTVFDDRALADNTQYYYQVIPLTNIGGTITPGAASEIVTARTEIDHPGPVTGLTAVPQTSTSVRLAWTPPTDTGGTSIRGYEIERAETSDRVWENYDPANDDLNTFETENGVEFPDFVPHIANTGSSAASFTDSMLTPNNVYFYRVRALNQINTSLIFSNIAGVFVSFAPPTNLRHTIAFDGSSVTLQWDFPTDLGGRTLEGAHIERSLNGINFTTVLANTESVRTNYTDIINGGMVYFYRVSAIAGGIEGPPSTAITVTVPPRPPSAPTTLTAIAGSESRIDLTWETPADDGGLPITGYDLDRSTSIGFPDGTGPEETFDETADPAAAIDGVADIASTITVPAESDFPIAHVIIDVNVTHSYRGDLDVTLTAPDGSMYTLKAVDFQDRAENIIESYSGDIFNNLIGTQSLGPWRLNVRDAFGALDHGVFNSWRIRIVRAVEPLMTFDLGLVNEFLDSGLTPETQYFYRVRAKHNTENGDYSNIANAETPGPLFGDRHDGDLEIPAGETVIIDEHREYDNIIIEGDGILQINAAVIQARSLTMIPDGRIIVDMTGCAGGIAGFTRGGAGGAGGRGGSIVEQEGQPGSPPTLTDPQTAVMCTSESIASDLFEIIRVVNNFIAGFTNQITGGMGSDGTAAQPSGAGGDGGRNSGRGSTGRRGAGGGGGDGGTGAQGADGVMGGGKLALIVEQVNGVPTIEALGIDGNDGNQGTGEEGRPGGGGGSSGGREESRKTGQPGTAGEPASILGTIGSEGSQGGIVYLLYENISALIRLEDDFMGDINGYALDASAASNVTLAHSGQLDGSALLQFIGSYLDDTGIFKNYRLIRSSGDQTVITFDYRLVTAGTTAPSLKMEIINPVDDAVLFTQSFAENPGVTNSGDKTASIDITDAVNDTVLATPQPPAADAGIDTQHDLGNIGSDISRPTSIVVDGDMAFVLDSVNGRLYSYDYNSTTHAISNRRLVSNLHSRHIIVDSMGKHGDFFFFPTSDSNAIWRYAYNPATNTLSGGIRLNAFNIPLTGNTRIDSMHVTDTKIIFSFSFTLTLQRFYSLDYDPATGVATNFVLLGNFQTAIDEQAVVGGTAVRGDRLYCTVNATPDDSRIFVFDYDESANTVSNRRVFGNVTGGTDFTFTSMDISGDSIFVIDTDTRNVFELESTFETTTIDTTPNLRVRFSTAAGFNTASAPISRIFIGRVVIESGSGAGAVSISEDQVDVTGGQGGQSGTNAGDAEQFLPARVDDGADGYKFISRLSDLAT